MTVATVIIPTFNHGPTLLHSVGSALAQTIQDIEVFIVGDGAPETTREIVSELMKQDERVRFFDNPKGPRTGEIHRHQALKEAQGEIVCYLSDDDLWLPDHIETIRHLLSKADFANALTLKLDAQGRLDVILLDLSYPGESNQVLAGIKGTCLSAMSHTLNMYRQLPYGWRTTPTSIYTDQYMQQQFLAHPSCRAVSGTRPTMLKFTSPDRAGWTVDKRLAELELWRDKFANPEGREKFVYEVLDVLVRKEVAVQHEYEDSVRWRFSGFLVSLPGVIPLVKFIKGAIQATYRAKEAPHHAQK